MFKYSLFDIISLMTYIITIVIALAVYIVTVILCLATDAQLLSHTNRAGFLALA
jgi:hypothetical protein